MIWFLSFFLISYIVLIASFSVGFKKISDVNIENIKTKTNFSVIIPFRNEAENLPQLLNSITALKYPKKQIEFIFVDDDSTDNSVEIIKLVLDKISLKSEISKSDIKILKNNRISNSPKKDAITAAIAKAKNQWIITTDADCILPKNWLVTFDSFIQKNNPKMIVGPVNYKVENTFLSQFQLLDFMSLQATTIGSFGVNFPFLCNGANLGYKKVDFRKLNGFEGNNNLASGDDVFLFEKFIKSDKKSVHYLKSRDAIVTTFPLKSWTQLIHQRTRWAAKTGVFKSLTVKLIGLCVLLTNFMVIFYVFTGPIKTMYIPFILKIMVDWFLLKPTLEFFNHKIDFVKWYIPASALYPFFSIYVVFNSIFFKYNWKGRTFKK